MLLVIETRRCTGLLFHASLHLIIICCMFEPGSKMIKKNVTPDCNFLYRTYPEKVTILSNVKPLTILTEKMKKKISSVS